MLFKTLDIIEPILKALKEEGYTSPTPIQERSIPAILQGKDLEGCAQTGTGKTAAFAVPILQLLYSGKEPRRTRETEQVKISALVLAPTRELAIQIGESFSSYGKYTGLRNTVIFGGVSQKSQTDILKAGVDILIATPGRLLDLMQQKFISLQDVKFFVLDEADRMLDMGLGHDVKRIISKLPKIKQTMLFSATKSLEISKLMDALLVDPVKVAVTPVSSTIDVVSQEVYMVDKKKKKSLLISLLKDNSTDSVLVFSRTKHGANKITGDLIKSGIEAQAIHGNKSQNARQLALNNFKEKKIRVLVATDIAARGIDVEELPLVINFDLPDVPETYVHRIGRTGRAGSTGSAISFCDEEEKPMLKDIQKVISKSIQVVENHPYLPEIQSATTAPKSATKSAARGKDFSGNSHRRNTSKHN
ncbi:MAG TPA: DEAD/DEAH box helicase [Clostridiaceae bacterium]